jgi:hypothetical protein
MDYREMQKAISQGVFRGRLMPCRSLPQSEACDLPKRLASPPRCVPQSCHPLIRGMTAALGHRPEKSEMRLTVLTGAMAIEGGDGSVAIARMD